MYMIVMGVGLVQRESGVPSVSMHTDAVAAPRNGNQELQLPYSAGERTLKYYSHPFSALLS